MILHLLANFTMLATFLFIFNFIFRVQITLKNHTTGFKVLTGFIYGLCGLLLLTFSFKVDDQTFIDFRHVILMLSAYYGRLLSVSITFSMLLLGRILIFPEFTSASIIALLLMTITSYFCMCYLKGHWKKWTTSIALSVIIIISFSILRGFNVHALIYVMFIIIGGLFCCIVIASVQNKNELTYQLEKSEKKFRSLHTLQSAIFQSTLTTSIFVLDKNGYISDANKATESILGYSLVELKGKDLFLLLTDTNYKNGREGFIRNTLYNFNKETELEFKKKNGSTTILQFTISSLLVEGKTTGYVGVGTDISDRKELEKYLRDQASTDGLTEIKNRRFFDEVLALELNKPNIGNEELTLIILDIDYFKEYNDLYGHVKGDECLRRVTFVIKEALNGYNTIFSRYGGEEFTILIPDSNNDEVVHLTEKIRNAVEEEKINHSSSLINNYVTISIGTSSINLNNRPSSKEFIEKADLSLYTSKKLGRNRVTIGA